MHVKSMEAIAMSLGNIIGQYTIEKKQGDVDKDPTVYLGELLETVARAYDLDAAELRQMELLVAKEAARFIQKVKDEMSLLKAPSDLDMN